jgi:hypothetical protein
MTSPFDIYRMDDVAAKLGKSRRWLQDFLRENPCGRRAGRTRLFTAADLAKLIEALPKVEAAPCLSRSSRRSQAARQITVSGEHTSESEWTEALRLVTGSRRSAYSQPSRQRSNVVLLHKSQP